MQLIYDKLLMRRNDFITAFECHAATACEQKLDQLIYWLSVRELEHELSLGLDDEEGPVFLDDRFSDENNNGIPAVSWLNDEFTEGYDVYVDGKRDVVQFLKAAFETISPKMNVILLTESADEFTLFSVA